MTICLLVLLTGFGGLLVSFSSLYLYLSPNLPAVETLRDKKISTPLRIYSADGKLIEEYGDKRDPISIQEVPPLLIKALIAIEDDRFYSHNGVEVSALLRAASHYLTGVGAFSGGSTLTMQLAKLFFLENDGSEIYKASQIILAMQLENELSKDEILELYLNVSFLGNRAYGIGAAAQVYYDKSVQELTLAEMATLVSTFQTPSAANPISNPARVLRRRNLVLKEMLDHDFIDDETYQQSIAEPLGASLYSRQRELDAPYIAEMARDHIYQQFQEAAYEDGYVVTVTIDSTLQKAAQKAVVEGLLQYDQRYRYRGPEEFTLQPIYVGNNPTTTVSETIDSPIAQPDDFFDELAEEDSLFVEDSMFEEKTVLPPRIYQLISKATPEQSEASTDLLNKDLAITNIDIAPWQQQLQSIASYAAIHPAAVLEAASDTLKVLLKDGDIVDIAWENGPSIYKLTNSKSEPANENYFKLGNVIRVREVNPGEWHLTQIPTVQGAFVALDPNNGAVKALVGGFNFNHNNFNRVTQAKRQPGSNFKPFLYTAALENGFSGGSIIQDQPITLTDSNGETWQPDNDDNQFLGPVRLREGLYRSRNVVAVRLLYNLGHEKAFKNIDRFGIPYKALPVNDKTLALGTYELTPLQLANAYAVFANGGYKVEHYFIERIEKLDGTFVSQTNPLVVCENCDLEDSLVSENEEGSAHNQTSVGNISEDFVDLEAQMLAELEQLDTPVDQLSSEGISNSAEAKTEKPPIRLAERVLDERTAYIINDILKDTIRQARGTAHDAQSLRRSDIAGKTGTTDNANDAWFTGFNSELVATSWVGYDDFTSLGTREYGSRAALPAWIEFMKAALKDVPEIERPMPDGLTAMLINKETGKPTLNSDPDARLEIFKIENAPDVSGAKINIGGEVDPGELF